MSRVDVLIEEYRTLRQESLQAQQQQHSILQFGLPSLGLLLGLAPGLPVPSSSVLLLLGVPVLTLLIVVIWSAELSRMMRAGGQLAELEETVNSLIGRRSLTWESKLQSGQLQRITQKDHAVTGLLLGIATLSIALGTIRLLDEDRWFVLSLMAPLGGLIVVGTAVLHLYTHHEVRGKPRRSRETGEDT